MGHKLVVECIKSCGGVRMVLFLFVGFLLFYIHIWQRGGSACNGGDDVMAVKIRFSPMEREVSWSG